MLYTSWPSAAACSVNQPMCAPTSTTSRCGTPPCTGPSSRENNRTWQRTSLTRWADPAEPTQQRGEMGIASWTHARKLTLAGTLASTRVHACAHAHMCARTYACAHTHERARVLTYMDEYVEMHSRLEGSRNGCSSHSRIMPHSRR